MLLAGATSFEFLEFRTMDTQYRMQFFLVTSSMLTDKGHFGLLLVSKNVFLSFVRFSVSKKVRFSTDLLAFVFICCLEVDRLKRAQINFQLLPFFRQWFPSMETFATGFDIHLIQRFGLASNKLREPLEVSSFYCPPCCVI